MEDGSLAAALRRGERRALDRAVERYTAYLSAVVRRTLGAAGTAQDVEELVSDVFLTLWRRRDGLEDRPLKPWLAAVARNRAVDWLRAAPPAPLPLEDDRAPAVPGPEGEVERREFAAALFAAVEALGEPDRSLVEGYYYEDRRLKDLARALGLSPAVKAARDECEGLYKQSVLDAAAQLAGQGDYDGAIAALNEGQTLLSDQELKDKAEEYRLEKLKGDQLVTVESTKVRQSFIYNDAIVVIKNQTDQVLKEYTVAMIMLDANGYPVNNTYSFNEFRGYQNVHGGRADSVNVQPGETYGGNSYWNIEGDCDQILACVVSAEFYDGTTWNNPYFDPWVKFYAERPVK